MSLVNEDNDVIINTLKTEVSYLRNEITELKQLVMELKSGKKRGPKKKTTLNITNISLVEYTDNYIIFLLNNNIEWKTTLSTLDNMIHTLKQNSKYEINN